MSKDKIKHIVQIKMNESGVKGVIETGIKGVQLFKVTESMRCAPAVYEPCVVAIVNGTKEAILDGKHFIYDENHYMCCAMSMPVEAGTPKASLDNPLLGVMISLDTKVMTELAIEMAAGGLHKPSASSSQQTDSFQTASAQNINHQTASHQTNNHHTVSQGLTLAQWDDRFTDALLRLLQLVDNPEGAFLLGDGRLRELYYAVLKGGAGESAIRAFGIGNAIARSIEYLSSRLHEVVTIDDMAAQVGMSRAVLHRRFKQATSMSPIQFVKAMRLNTAAMKIAGGMNVNTAAMEVGYQSSSQFSREFKRLYGQSPKQWSQAKTIPEGLAVH